MGVPLRGKNIHIVNVKEDGTHTMPCAVCACHHAVLLDPPGVFLPCEECQKVMQLVVVEEVVKIAHLSKLKQLFIRWIVRVLS